MISIVVLGHSDAGPQGATQLLESAIRTVRSENLQIQVVTDRAVVLDLLGECGDPTRAIVFCQEEGQLSAGYYDFATHVLETGAKMVELNVFNLPSRFRPRHDNYVMGCYTLEGYWRYRLRSFGHGTQACRKVLILPNPSRFVPSEMARSCSQDGQLRWLRVGRPDPIKWGSWEKHFLEVLSVNSNALHILTLVGEPPTLQSPKPLGYAIENFDYLDDIELLYACNDVLVHHSRIGETFGNVLLEAQDMGLYVVFAADPQWDCGPLAFLEPESSTVATRDWLVRNHREVESRVRRFLESDKEKRPPHSQTTQSTYIEALIQVLDEHGAQQFVRPSNYWRVLTQLTRQIKAIEGVRLPSRYALLEILRGAKLRLSRDGSTEHRGS